MLITKIQGSCQKWQVSSTLRVPRVETTLNILISCFLCVEVGIEWLIASLPWDGWRWGSSSIVISRAKPSGNGRHQQTGGKICFIFPNFQLYLSYTHRAQDRSPRQINCYGAWGLHFMALLTCCTLYYSRNMEMEVKRVDPIYFSPLPSYTLLPQSVS